MKKCLSLFLACAMLTASFGTVALAESPASGKEPGTNFGANKAITGQNYDPRYAVTCHNGTFVGQSDGKAAVWRGIPFAKPPVGDLRFMAPVRADADNGVYEAYNFAKKPYTTSLGNGENNNEDCLYLNVYTGDNDIKNKPVMVWIHGGAFVVESAGEPYYRGDAFAAAYPDVVLVTIEYRLGVLGFLDLQEIPGSQPGAVNNGIKDQIMALKWIKENIAGFGGDPENITIFGESAGGISVSLLCLIPEAKGLFQKAIMQSGFSGSVRAPLPRLEPARNIRDFYNARTIEDFQKIPVEDLFENFDVIDYAYGPCADGLLIPSDPYQAYLDGAAADLPVMVGYTANECRYFHQQTKWPGTERGSEASFLPWMRFVYDTVKEKMTPEDSAIAEKFVSESGKSEAYAIEELMTEMSFGIPCRKQADVLANKGNVYMYYYAFPTYPLPQGALHAAEVPMIFRSEKIVAGLNTADPNYETVRDTVGDAWVSFAKTGVPAINGKPAAPYTSETKDVIVFDTDGRTFEKDHFFTEKYDAIAPLLAYEGTAATCNFAMPVHVFRQFGIGEP